MPGKLIVIEGTDGVGKQTQTNLLLERLRNEASLEGATIRTWEFPNYPSPWGQLIRQYLDDKSPFSRDPAYATMLYSADRAAEAIPMKEALANGDWILCDRYTSSNAGFQSARMPDSQQRSTYLEWLEWLEYEHFGIPRPDLTILLTLPVEVSHKRTEARRAESAGIAGNHKVGTVDINEADKPFMETVGERYIELAETHAWPVITCADESGNQLSRETIHTMVWDKVTPLISEQ